MISCYILVFPIYFITCFGLTETKHMSGGVFGWPDALKSQRNLWGNTIFFNKIKLYKAELELPKLIREQFFDSINLNLTEKINDLLQKFQDSSNEEDSSKDTETEQIHKNLFDFNYFSSILQSKPTTYFEDNDDENCDAYINTKLFGKKPFDKLSCEDNDLYIGQFLSYAFIFMPILIIGLLAFIFYIVFCFGCCCCCKARDRTCPGIVSIVFFAVITACMLIAVIFHIVGAVYLMNIINFVTSDQLFDEVEETIDLIEPTLNNALSGTNVQIKATFDSFSDGLFTAVNELGPGLTDTINYTINNASLLTKFYKNISKVGEEKKKEVDDCEKNYNAHENGNCVKDYHYDEKINFIGENVNFTLLNEVCEQIEEEIKKMSESIDLSEQMKPITEELNSTFSDSFSQINIDNMSVSDFGSTFEDLKNIREEFDINEYLPSWGIILIKALLFVVSILMLLVLLLQVLAFWTRNCCSRCIVGACCPCCFCSCCQTICGILATFMGFVLLIINIFYNQGDDIVNELVKKITNENKTIQFEPLNLSGLSKGLISEIVIDDLRIRDISLVKSFVDAKLDSSLSDLVGFKDLPFGDIAELLNDTLSNSKALNVNKLIDPLANTINTLMNDFVNNFDLSSSFNLSGLIEAIDAYRNKEEKGTCLIKFNEVNDSYYSFNENISAEFTKIGEVNNTISENTESSIKAIRETSTELLNRPLQKLGTTFHDTIFVVEDIFKSVDAKFIIGLFNIVRVRFFYQIMGYCMCVSISAHLYIIGMWAMTILLWIRRKGMAYEARQSTIDEYSYSYSISYSEDEDTKKRKKKGKKKGKHLSEDENTSDGNDVEVVGEFQDKDIKNSDDDEGSSKLFSTDNDQTDTQQSSIKDNEYEERGNEQISPYQLNNSDNSNNQSDRDDESNTAASISNKVFDDDDENEDENSEPMKVSENGIDVSFKDSTENDNSSNNDSVINNSNNNNNNNVDRSSTDDNTDDDGDDDDIQQSYVF